MSDVMHDGGLIATRYDGEIIEAYAPREDGDCDVLWMFDGVGLPDAEPRKYLLARLTEEEARKVFERDRTKVGILEPVRHSMVHPEARIFQNLFEGGSLRGAGEFAIPSDGDELAFLNALDEAPVLTMAYFEQESRNQLARLHQLERDLDDFLADVGPLARPLVSSFLLLHRWRIRRLRRKIERGNRAERALERTVDSGATKLEHRLA